MAIPKVVLIPVGKVDAAEVEGAAVRASKVLRSTIAIREPIALPRVSEDAGRGQHDAPKLLAALRAAYPTSKPGKTVGADVALPVAAPGAGPASLAKPGSAPSHARPAAPPPPGTVTYVPPGGDPPKPSAPAVPPASSPPAPRPDVFLFITDVDLFAGNADGIFTQIAVPLRTGLLSVRRLREAFYRRKADPTLQRSRVVKEILRLAALGAGLSECGDPKCVLSSAVATAEIDRQQEHYCAACWKRMAQGAMRV